MSPNCEGSRNPGLCLMTCSLTRTKKGHHPSWRCAVCWAPLLCCPHTILCTGVLDSQKGRVVQSVYPPCSVAQKVWPDLVSYSLMCFTLRVMLHEPQNHISKLCLDKLSGWWELRCSQWTSSEQQQCCLCGRLPRGPSTSHLSPVTLYQTRKELTGQALALPATPCPTQPHPQPPDCFVLKWSLQVSKTRCEARTRARFGDLLG